MKNKLSERSKDIETVIRERDRLILECRLLNTDLTEKKDVTIIQNRLIRISGILSNIRGFCDRNSRKKINLALRYFGVAMISKEGEEIDLVMINVRALLPLISGFAVDFKNRPFKVIGFSLGPIAMNLKRE